MDEESDIWYSRDLAYAKKWWSQDLNPSWLMCETKDITVILSLIFIAVSTLPWLHRVSDQMYNKPRCDLSFPAPLLEETTTTLSPLMRLNSMGLKVKIYDCSLVFREFLVLSISLIQGFQWLQIHVHFKAGQSCVKLYSKASYGWKVLYVPPWRPGGQILCLQSKAKDFPRGATARQLWTRMVLKKEIMINPGTSPNLVPHSLTFLAASI